MIDKEKLYQEAVTYREKVRQTMIAEIKCQLHIKEAEKWREKTREGRMLDYGIELRKVALKGMPSMALVTTNKEELQAMLTELERSEKPDLRTHDDDMVVDATQFIVEKFLERNAEIEKKTNLVKNPDFKLWEEKPEDMSPWDSTTE